ncbi:hypothetical protein [Marinobacter sp. KMM 10035]|uniref:hypothetical protein n=1 Tax=Marinobacter sp. KMM 10035 TaxID=3134034 RepID=UPI00397D4CA3
MKSQFFEHVLNHTEVEFKHLVEDGDIESARLIIEYWRSENKWDQICDVIVHHRDQLPDSCELYLAECDEIWSKHFDSKHIPLANKNVCESHIESLQAMARYYFRKKGCFTSNVQKHRQQIREYRKKVPSREHLWDVLYAETLKVRNKRHLDRVLELCSPAIRNGDKDLDSSELAYIALTIVFNAALRAREPEIIRKALGSLLTMGHLILDDNSLISKTSLFGALESSYDCSPFGDIKGTSTTAHLSRLYLALCRHENYANELKTLENHLCTHGPQDPINPASLYLDLTPLSYPLIAPISEDHLCDLIRLKQGALSGLDDTEKRLAALCHAVGGVASIGLGEKETNKDIRSLTEDCETFWASRGLAHRIIRDGQPRLVPIALRYLRDAYERTGWSAQKGDPLFLFAFGTEALASKIDVLAQWILSLETKDAFNQAVEDVLIPVIAGLPSVEDEGACYSNETKALMMECASRSILRLTPTAVEAFGMGFNSMGAHEELLSVMEGWLQCSDMSGDELEKSIYCELTSTVELYLPQRLRIEHLIRMQGYFSEKMHLEQIDAIVDELEKQISDSTKSTNHYMIFQSSRSPAERQSLDDIPLREILHLGAVCSFLESPTGQSIIPFRNADGHLTINPNGWSPMLKTLLQHQLLQIRADGPEGSFDLDQDGMLSWYPAEVELAVNVRVDGQAGESQSGIMLSLPTLIRRRLLATPLEELLSLWNSLIRAETKEYFLRCLEYFDFSSEPVKGDDEVFLDTPKHFSLEELLNLIYNNCRAAAGDQKAERRSLVHARNRARRMLKTRLSNAVSEDWHIGPGFRGDLMPIPYLVEYFSETFLPLGQTVYERERPNVSSIEKALLALRVGS